MPTRLRLLTAATLIPLLAGCSDIRHQLAQIDDLSPSGRSAPKIEVVNESPPPAPAPIPPRSPQPTPFGPSKMSLRQAQDVFRDDPMALRFLAVRDLAENALLPGADIARRVNTNIGALLPLTAVDRPAEGLEAPIPPMDSIRARFRRLDGDDGRTATSIRAAERDFLLDQLLPANPAKRMVLAPHDKESGRMVLQRLTRLEEAGLVTAEERDKEAQAIEALMATLPEKLEPPAPPPAPAKKKKVARASSGGDTTGAGTNPTRRLPGGVSGKFEVVPSPLAFEPPKITADFKGPAGAHLLSMASVTHGDKAWEALQNQFKAELAELSYKVSRTDLGELGVTYRLIAGPMEATAAERLCSTLRQKGQACMPTPFPE